jgi:phosphoglycolate phosphatase
VTGDYDGIVYDLDGTLVDLAVDWEAVRDDVAAVYESAEVPVDGDLWSLFERASEHGLAADVESAIAAHEREGARQSRRLSLSDSLLDTEAAVAVCSLNCEAACRIALDVHDLRGHVSAVVGRDTLDAHKPDPAPLEYALATLDVSPERGLFVGDSPRDARTADRAGVDFRFVESR